jgi:hypothetical protein
MKKGFLFSLWVMGIAFVSCNFFASLSPEGYRLSSFTLSKNSISMPAGAMDMLSVSVDPPGVQDDLAIEWSYDSSVIEVRRDNYTLVITGLKTGETILRGTAEGVTSSACVVSITEGSREPVITNPYVYSNTEIVFISPGERVRVGASLYGGTSADIGGYTFSIDKPLVAALITEGNYAWITGRGEGTARVSIRHNRAAYAYTFLVSCLPNGRAVPYITTSRNVLTINKTTEPESSLQVELQNPSAQGYENLFSYQITDEAHALLTDPPVSLAANGARALITPLRAGECYVRVTHPSALYSLDVLVRVIEQLNDVYISPSDTILYVPGASAQTISASLANVPANVSVNENDFAWIFPPEAADYLSWTVFGGSEDGKGNALWITGKKSGSLRLTISHPLAMYSRDVFIIVKNIAGEAADASTYITTSQNYITARTGDDDINLSIYINNASSGDESLLHWNILNDAADGSSDPVVAFTGGTGASSSASVRSAAPVPIATGYALISPKKEGTAVITISHPKAVYDTKVLVSVAAAGTPQPTPFAISTATPVNILQNGQSLDLSVTLSGPGLSPADYSALLWQSDSPNISITPNGLSASVTALGEGSGRETITVSHPQAPWPLSITIVRYDTPEDFALVKFIAANNPYLTIFQDSQAYLYLDLFNLDETDPVSWNLKSGDNTVISFTQESKSRAAVTGLAPGTAVVTASFGTDSVSFYINVRSTGQIDEALPAYLSTSQNVLLLDPDGQGEVSITPINIAAAQYENMLWDNSNPALIDLIPNGAAATIQAKGESGKAALTVSHPLAANALEIFVHVGDRYVYKNIGLAYISLSHDALTLKAGDPGALFHAVLAHTESPEISSEGFEYTLSNSSVAALSPSGDGVLISPKKAGQVKLIVSHALAASREALIIVEPPEGETGEPYITTAQNVITIIAGETATAAVSLVNKTAHDPAAWSWTSLDTSTVQVLANNGPTAMISSPQPGTARLRVAHESALHSLELIVISLDSGTVQARPWITTSTNILTLRLNGSATLSAEMTGGTETDNAAFVWSPQDSTALFLSASGPSAFVKGLRAGLSYITVRNANYPDAYAKTILVLVEDAVSDDCYITVSQSIIKLKPASPDSATVKATLVGGGVLDPENFVWWADDYQMLNLTSITDTAHITPREKSGMTTVHLKHPKTLAVVDILVVISNFDRFGFSVDSITIGQGAIAFVPMQVPPSPDAAAVVYSSPNNDVCTVAGSSSVAMIAGIGYGTTTLTAAMKDSKGIVIGTSELPVIVSYAAPDENKISSRTSIVNMQTKTSQTLQASLSGPGIGPADEYDIQWVSSDPSVLSILATEQNISKGNAAYVTAKSSGEAVITLSHPKCAQEEQIWVLIPDQNEVGITLDETYIELYKDDGSRAITATLLNGTAADYEAITWTAPKAGGQVIVSVSKAAGKTCNIVPRSVGQTTLRAQLPSGAYADCIISVRSAAEINLETLALHVNPGYTETVKYTTNPESANVTWIGMSNTGGDISNIFSFQVNDSAKTISITGKDPGNGYLQGYFASSQGSSTRQLQVFVEYNYRFDLKTSGYITREPRPGTVIQIPFTVYPNDMVVTAASSDESNLIINSISQNSLSGEGVVEVTPLGEKNNLFITLKAQNPRDMVNPPLERTQYFNFRYDNLTITPVFDYAAGSFTEYKNNILYLGDGEEKLFHLDISEPNAQIDNIEIEWINGNSPDSRTGSDGKITLAKEQINGTTGKQMWRLKHKEDYTTTELNFYLVTKALKYKVWKTGIQGVQTLNTEANQGINGWNYYTTSWDNGKLLGNVTWTEGRWYATSTNAILHSVFDNWDNIYSFSEGDPGTPREYSNGDNKVEVVYEDISPYVMHKDDFEKNPNFFRPLFLCADFRQQAGGLGENYFRHKEYLPRQLHKYATPTTTREEGFLAEYDASFAVSYKRFNGETATQYYPVKVQTRMCEAYSKDRWKLVGKKYVFQY